jgi:THO complex subunit 4
MLGYSKLIDGTKQIEIVVSAAKAAEILPTPKTLTERISQPKAQPKSAANDKKKDAGKAVGAGARGRNKKGRPARSARPTKKTQEELDSEMADYWESGNQNENVNGVAANTNTDAAMEDEISVSLSIIVANSLKLTISSELLP